MPDLTTLSLGAGVQSSVMALMAAKGDITPLPDYLIFADTGWEPVAVYEHLDWLESELNQLSAGRLKLHRVSNGNIREDLLAWKNSTGQRFATIPYFTSNGGMGRRQCTREYKIEPIRQEVRRLLGMKKGQHVPKDVKVVTWIGISTDEAVRMKQAPDKWNENRWPLIELGMSRRDCLQWFEQEYPDRKLPKSSCIGCPYHDNNYWRNMKHNDAESWRDAVYMDGLLRKNKLGQYKYDQYMHPSLQPLDQVDLRTAREMGQREFGFLDECDGICGV